MTTDKSKTADLIARLEAAEHGSRELDARIMLMLRPELGVAPYTQPDIGFWRARGGYRTVEVRAPHYTTSLDAITTLIAEKLPGWSGTADIVRSDRADGKFSAEVRPLAAEIGEDVEGNGKTSVLAVCIAFLRAIEGTSHDT
jgi:hypothetical protein